jgi:ABC-type protease/lipase transport system fused ATPase/permease subunit
MPMLFMVELHYPKDRRMEVLRQFEEFGVTHHGPHVVIKGAWVATEACVAYALVEASAAAPFDEACLRWSQFGELKSNTVIDIEQI